MRSHFRGENERARLQQRPPTTLTTPTVFGINLHASYIVTVDSSTANGEQINVAIAHARHRPIEPLSLGVGLCCDAQCQLCDEKCLSTSSGLTPRRQQSNREQSNVAHRHCGRRRLKDLIECQKTVEFDCEAEREARVRVFLAPDSVNDSAAVVDMKWFRWAIMRFLHNGSLVCWFGSSGDRHNVNGVQTDTVCRATVGRTARGRNREAYLVD
jgi:hypothetical protein